MEDVRGETPKDPGTTRSRKSGRRAAFQGAVFRDTRPCHTPQRRTFPLLDEMADCVAKFSRIQDRRKVEKWSGRKKLFYQTVNCGVPGVPGPVRRRRSIFPTGAADRVANPLPREAPGIDFFAVVGKMTSEPFDHFPEGRNAMPLLEMEEKPELEAGIAYCNPSVLSFFAPVVKSVQLILRPMVTVRHDPGLVLRQEALPGYELLDPFYHLGRGAVSPCGEAPEPDRGILALKKREVVRLGSLSFDGNEK